MAGFCLKTNNSFCVASYLLGNAIKRLKPMLDVLFKFMVAQGTASFLNMMYGFICIRVLSIEEYSKYVVFFTVQATVTVLMDSGITGTIIPLIGDKVNNNQLIADYVASLRGLAHILYIIVGIGTTTFFPQVIIARHWDLRSSCVMIAVLLALTWFARVSSAYGAVLIVKKDRTYWCNTQIYSSAIMLLLLLSLYEAGRITALGAMIINLGGAIFTASRYYMRSKYHLVVRGSKKWSMQKSIIQLASPAIPGVIFYSFQGQIGIYMLTFLGKVESVASIGALSKICQMTNYVSPINPVLVEPFFARLEKRKLIKWSIAILSCALFLCVVLVAVVKVVPEIFLWIIGPHYKELHGEIFIAVIPGVLAVLGGVISSINSARRFNYYRFNVANIIITLGVQFACMTRMNLSSLHSVLVFNVISSIPGMVLVSLTLIYGMKFGGRRVAFDTCE